MHLTAYVRPADGEAYTCAAPDGYIQFYINGVKVGDPVQVQPVTTYAARDNTYASSEANVTLAFKDNTNYPKVPEMLTTDDFIVTASYYQGTNYTNSKAAAQKVEEPENFPYVTPPILVVTPVDPSDLGEEEELKGDYQTPEKIEREEISDGVVILHSYVEDQVTAMAQPDTTRDKAELIGMMNYRYGFANPNYTVAIKDDQAYPSRMF